MCSRGNIETYSCCHGSSSDLVTFFDVEIVTISDDLHYWPAILNFYPLLKILNFAKYDGTALFCYLYWPLTKCLEIHLSAAVLLYSCNLIIKKKCSVSPCHLLAFKRFNRYKKKYMGKVPRLEFLKIPC